MNYSNIGIPNGSVTEIMRYDTRNKLASMVLIYCYCNFLFNAVFKRVVGEFAGQAFFKMLTNNMILIFPVLLCVFIVKRKCTVWPLYVFIYTYLALTWIMHPEYTNFFLSDNYGVFACFFSLTCSIFLPLIFSLFSDEHKLLNAILVGTKIKFVLLLLQYMNATIRGYWNGKDYLGNDIKLSYDLAFGYDMIFCGIVFLMLYIFVLQKRYLLYSIVSFFTVLMGGSRGTWLCLIAMLFFCLVMFRDKYNLSLKKCCNYFLFSMPIIMILYVSRSVIVKLVKFFTAFLGLHSRTLDMLLSGTIASDNGRTAIMNVALDMVSTSGLFGYGIYGDRFAISKLHFCGYPHNIFLEILIQFGWLGATLILGYIFYKIFQMVILCDNDIYKILLVIYLSTSVKLLVSDSFWYNSAFWSLIGILMFWNWQRNSSCKYE